MKEFKELRENFGLFATGVAIATTAENNNFNIVTINSLTSISLDPALLLFCIDNKSSNFEAFTKNKNFAINLLTEDQIELSKTFSKSGTKDFDLEKYFFTSNSNNLILKDSLGYFECRQDNILPCGDHHIVIGRISNFSKLNKDKKPLLYFKGKYNSL